MRAFVAVTVPPKVVDVLAAMERPAFDNLRWTTPEQWHVTLRFLGEIPDAVSVGRALESVPGALASTLRARPRVVPGAGGAIAAGEPAAGVAAGEAAAGVAAGEPATGIVAELGPVTAWFPGRRVLQVAVAGLDALAQAVTDATEPFGTTEDARRPFVGHLTLARVRGSRPGPGRLAGLPVHAAWSVGHVVLMGSTLGPGGARYQTLATVALAP